MSDEQFIEKYEELLNKGYCDCNEMNCIDNNSPRRILNIVKGTKLEAKQLLEENQELKKQLEYLHSGEYLNQLRFERNMLQDVVEKMEVSKEDKKFIDMTHRNTQLLEENRKYEEVIDKLKNIINEMINCGYIVENGESAVNYMATGSKSEFGTRAKVLLNILKEVEHE